MRALDPEDVPFVIECLQTMRLESPVYSLCDDDPEHVYNKLVPALVVDAMYGVVEPGYGFMLGVTSDTWYSAEINAHELLLYVLPSYRGGLLAVRLIRAFEQRSKDRGASNLYVGASSGMQEERTEALYERLGYHRHGRSLVKRLIDV